MPVDPVLASYGDLAYGTALVLYLFAMILHAVEYAAARMPTVAAAQPATADGVGPAGTVTTLLGPPGAPRRDKPERIGRSAVALTVLAVLVHGSSLVLRGVAAGRLPWGNMYEFASAICFVAVAAWLILLYRHQGATHRAPARDTPGSGAPGLRRLGVFVLLPIVVLLFLGGTVLYAEAAPLVPALNSYWIAIHVSAAIGATGILLVSGVASVLYLVQNRFTGRIAAQLPGSATLDRLAYRTTVIAFPIWTFALITGAIWAEVAWGRYWGWDPKETVGLVAWVVYAGYLHARATAGWRGSRAAWINVAGFGVMLFNFFFVNIVIAGLHSYAGI